MTDHPPRKRSRLEITPEGDLLIYAIQSGNIPELERILTVTPDRKNSLTQGRTLFHYAAKYDQPRVVDKLIQIGCSNIDSLNEDGNTPIHVAIKKNHPAVIVALIRNGSQAINTPNSDGLVPIHLAAGISPPSMIDLLVESGSHLEFPLVGIFSSPLWTAVFLGNFENIERLVYHGCEINSIGIMGLPLIAFALQMEDIRSFQTLIVLGAKVDIITPDSEMESKINLPIDPEFALGVRERVYLSPLTPRLLRLI